MPKSVDNMQASNLINSSKVQALNVKTIVKFAGIVFVKPDLLTLILGTIFSLSRLAY